MINEPKISIVIPTYNRKQYLFYTIDSLLSQNYKNKEIIIIDDGSTDNTYEECREKFKYIDDIKIYKLEKNIGQSKARNYGLSLISKDSKYLLLHDSDDISTNINKLNKLVEFLEINEDENFIGVGCLGEYIDETGKRLNKYPANVLIDYEDIRNDFHNVNHFLIGSVLFNINILNKFIKDNKEFFTCNKKTLYQDYNMFSKMLMQGYKLQNLNFIGLQVRWHSEQISRTKKNDFAISNLKRIQTEYKQYLIKNKLLIEKQNVGVIIIATNKYVMFIDELIKSIKQYFLLKHNVHIYIFTDKDIKYNDLKINIIKINHEKFPGPSLFRYKYIDEHKIYFKDLDYLFYIDADMKIVNEIDDSIFSDLTVVKHFGFIDKDNKQFTYERNVKSTSYIHYGQGIDYYFGCFQGGKTNTFLKMCSVLKDNIEKDLQNNIIAIWWDESHLNKYCIKNKPTKILPPNYVYPEDWKEHSNLKSIPKIISIKKDVKYLRDNQDYKSLLNEPKLNIIKPQNISNNSFEYNKQQYLIKKKVNLVDCDFIVPVMIDSDERVRNVNSCVSFIQTYFITNTILNEYCIEPKLKFFKRQQLELTQTKTDNVDYFHKTKTLNESYKLAKNEYLIILNPDVFLEPEQLLQGLEIIKSNKADIVIPYDKVINVYNQNIIQLIRHKKPKYLNDNDLKEYGNNNLLYGGGCIIIKKSLLNNIGNENEQIKSVGYESLERYERINKCDYKLEFIKNSNLYHLNHKKEYNICNNDELIYNNLKDLKKEKIQIYLKEIGVN